MIARLKPLALLFLLFGPSSSALAAEFILNIVDPTGSGFNDPTPAQPVGGNPGQTIGEQRVNVILRAFEILGATIRGDVPIVVQGTFTSLACDQNSAVLAGAFNIRREVNFPGAPLPDTSYPVALANQLAGMDLNREPDGSPDPGPLDPAFFSAPFNDDIAIQINANIDSPSCLGGGGWYYGFDHSEGPGSDLLPVLIHEITHGLGFSSRTSQSGFFSDQVPDIMSRMTLDTETGLRWDQMTQQQRASSVLNDPDVVWIGSEVTELVEDLLVAPAMMTIESPVNISGEFDVQVAQFGPPVPTFGISGRVVLIDDGDLSQGSVTDGCEGPFANADQIRGNLALIDRGVCLFTEKVVNAQSAGALAVLIANNQPQGLPPMGGNDPAVAIPSVGISMASGSLIKSEADVFTTLSYEMSERAGTTSGFLRLHAPNPYEVGSSVSHWSTAASPDLVMEPSISGTLTDSLDFTAAFLRDLGWETTKPRSRPSRPRSPLIRPVP